MYGIRMEKKQVIKTILKKNMCINLYTHTYIKLQIHTDTRARVRACFPGKSAGKESTCNAGDPGSISGSRRSAGEGNVYPLQYSGPGFNPWFGKIPWRRERLPTPVFWLGEFHGSYIYL